MLFEYLTAQTKFVHQAAPLEQQAALLAVAVGTVQIARLEVLLAILESAEHKVQLEVIQIVTQVRGVMHLVHLLLQAACVDQECGV
jgi:hypothetical protein